ncbi:MULTISPECIES: formyltransferase family protein [unclassified Treponema]|uniref:formyltransferase family protein n=1 Tax=unclassified Treponema TaxID=2638727 RepID=UPI0020A472A2|nr:MULTISPECIES: formyltransferase family protein [unclassified Treponema]UTC68213.1 hypothetical protein E4O06_06155 [Treponema sp. OMZ 789]UTC70933.1 hypothetical protein E4O01_06300 [Treponema sp. OMZ 790]UTC73673.1 hypothetical protein E4O02_06495 [Treponema sp. OMZ 791]
MINVIYIGNYYKIPEMIYHHPQLCLKGIIFENDKINDELITFSLVRDIPLISIKTSKDIIKTIKNTCSAIDFFIMCSFGKRIPMEELETVKIFNIHYSALPNYKGRHPTFWATIANEKKIGISLHEVTSKIDEGNIVAQKTVPYYIWMKETELFDCLTEKVPLLLDELISYLKHNTVCLENTSDFYYPMVKEENYLININTDNLTLIYNKVRAQSRYRGAKIIISDKEFWIKNIAYTFLAMQSDYIIKNNDTLYIKYNDEICIKTKDFEVS